MELLLALGCLVAFIYILQVLMKRFLDPLPVASQVGAIALGLLLILLANKWYLPNQVRNRPPCEEWFTFVAQQWCEDSFRAVTQQELTGWPLHGLFQSGSVEYELLDCNIVKSQSVTYPFSGMAQVCAYYHVPGVGIYARRNQSVVFRFRRAPATECTDNVIKAKAKLGYQPWDGPKGSIYYNGDWQFVAVE